MYIVPSPHRLHGGEVGTVPPYGDWNNEAVRLSVRRQTAKIYFAVNRGHLQRPTLDLSHKREDSQAYKLVIAKFAAHIYNSGLQGFPHRDSLTGVIIPVRKFL